MKSRKVILYVLIYFLINDISCHLKHNGYILDKIFFKTIKFLLIFKSLLQSHLINHPNKCWMLNVKRKHVFLRLVMPQCSIYWVSSAVCAVWSEGSAIINVGCPQMDNKWLAVWFVRWINDEKCPLPANNNMKHWHTLLQGPQQIYQS